MHALKLQVHKGSDPSKDGLWAWVTPASLVPSLLRSELQKTLPQYMVPSRIVPLAALPLTPNGKIDKRRLVAETREGVTEDDLSLFVAPAEGLERRLAAAAAEALGLERLGATTELRAAGLTSLKAVLLAQRLRDMQLTLPLAKVYELQTVRRMAEHLSQQATTVAVRQRTNSRGACGGSTSGFISPIHSYSL